MKKRGVSPIIAVLLLIIIAVAAAVVTYGFVMGFIGGATTTTGATQARIVVDAVSYNNTANNLTVYVRNAGPIPINVTGVYVYGADGTLADANTTIVGEEVGPGEVKQIIAENIKLVAGVYYVKVVTQEGAVATSDVFRV